MNSLFCYETVGVSLMRKKKSSEYQTILFNTDNNSKKKNIANKFLTIRLKHIAIIFFAS